MRKIVLVVLLLVWSSTTLFAEEVFKNEDEKVGYAIGMNIGVTMKQNKDTSDADQIAAGLKAALKGEPTLISASEMGQIISQYRQGGERQAELIKNNEKVSYAIGMNLGVNMKQARVAADADQIAAGLRDALKGEPTLLSDAEMGQIMFQYRQEDKQRKTELMEKMKASANEYLEKSMAFMKENSKRDGVVTLKSGLQYKVLVNGDGASPSIDKQVKVNYRGTLFDGTEFDSSYAYGQPVDVYITGVIAGWAEALQMMKEGDKWQIAVPSGMAYGLRGAPPAVPPNAALVYELELLEILD